MKERNWMKALLSGIFILVGSFGVQAQIQMEVIADTNRMMVGDQQKLVFVITCDPAVEIVTLDLDSITAVEGFELLDERNWVEKKTPMSKILTKDITFTAFNPGEYNFPEVPYQYSLKGNMKTGTSKSWKLTVLPLNTSEEDIAPNKDIIVEVDFFDKYKWIIFTLAGLGLLALIIFIIKKIISSNRKIEEKPYIKPDPAKVAAEELSALRQSGLWKSEEHKVFQTALSGILRKYLADAHNVPALFSTSHEIVDHLKILKMPEHLIDTTDKALNIADLVKFANAQSRQAINYDFIEKVENLVIEAELFKSMVTNQ